ncbi:DUF1990 family protein [Nocardioides sp. 616]|uniref:DUF1990 family protein n=1 Tax=Nocardioides sp. 616 TaxID=2268090 RepID=UPI00196688F9|nr:DUF1990 family protein [Nocardioides sp. 616]
MDVFVVRLESDGTVRFTVAATSRPQWALARVARPATRLVQLWMMGRYLRVLRALRRSG